MNIVQARDEIHVEINQVLAQVDEIRANPNPDQPWVPHTAHAANINNPWYGESYDHAKCSGKHDGECKRCSKCGSCWKKPMQIGGCAC